MALVLSEETLPARTSLQGVASVTLTAGQHLKIETTPRGEELLDAVVPAGKTWTVVVNVHVQEA